MGHTQASRVLVAAVLAVMLACQLAWSQDHQMDMQKMQATSGASDTTTQKLKVAVLLYDGALLLDYGIAAEMFLAADFMRRFDVFTVAQKSNATVSILGAVTTAYTFENMPRPDILIVPGGPTWSQEAARPEMQTFLKQARDDGCIIYSICTGALLLGQAGLLDAKDATTNHQATSMLRKIAPKANVFDDRTYVDAGDIVTAAGAGTAIEATLHLIERLTTPAIANDLRKRYLDYPCSDE